MPIYTEEQLNAITSTIIGCAIAVHRALGPGLLESVYHNAVILECRSQSVPFETEKRLPVYYRDQLVGDFRLDLLIGGIVVVELKSTSNHNPLFEAQIINYIRIGKYPLGLLINFNHKRLKDGIQRFRL